MIELTFKNTDEIVPLSSLKPGDGFIFNNKLFILLKLTSGDASLEYEVLEYEGGVSFTCNFLSSSHRVIQVDASINFTFNLSQAQRAQLGCKYHNE